MQSLLELQQSAGNSIRVVENVKSDLFPEMRSSCSRRRGRIVWTSCRRNSLMVDFAYAVHTDVGNMCVGARVDMNPCHSANRWRTVKPLRSSVLGRVERRGRSVIKN